MNIIEDETIMICTDLGKISSCVIKKGIALAVKLKAPIHLVHVMTDEKATPHATPNKATGAAKNLIQRQNRLDRAREYLRDSGCEYTVATPLGEVTEELIKEINRVKPHMLVMGALNNTALRHVVSGSVAGTILGSTGCPVLLIPEEKCPE